MSKTNKSLNHDLEKLKTLLLLQLVGLFARSPLHLYNVFYGKKGQQEKLGFFFAVAHHWSYEVVIYYAHFSCLRLSN